MKPDGLRDKMSSRSYDPVLKTMEKITAEKGWDTKTTDFTNELRKNITDPSFLVALNVFVYTLGNYKAITF